MYVALTTAVQLVRQFDTTLPDAIACSLKSTGTSADPDYLRYAVETAQSLRCRIDRDFDARDQYQMILDNRYIGTGPAYVSRTSDPPLSADVRRIAQLRKRRAKRRRIASQVHNWRVPVLNTVLILFFVR